MKQRLGNFEIVEQIDPSGFTTVYRAVEQMGQGITRPVALKILQTWNLDDQEQLAILRREVEVLVELGACPHIVSIHGFGIDEESGPWIAMELAGRSLKHFITDDPAEPEQVRVLLRDTLRALAVVHGSDPPILHRDLKPANILSTDYGVWKVADFGLAKRRGADDTLNLVTVQYAAPELLNATLGEESARIDLYSLGMTAYEYALGHTLYRQQFPSVYDPYSRKGDRAASDERPKWMYWHTSMQMTVPPVADVIDDYPRDLSDLIAAMTAKPLEERIPSANKALRLLGSVESTALPLEVTEVEEEEIPRRSRISATAVLSAIAIVLLLGVAYVMFVQGESRPVIRLREDRVYSGNTDLIRVAGSIERFPDAGRAKVKMGNVERDAFVNDDGSFYCDVPMAKLWKQPARLIVKDGSREVARENLTVERIAPESVAVVVTTRPTVAEVEVVIEDLKGEQHRQATNVDGVARFENVPYGQFALAWGHGLYKPRGWPQDTFPTLYRQKRKIDTGIDPELEHELRLEQLTAEEVYGRTQASMLRVVELSKKKANCPPGPLSEDEEEELAGCIREMRQMALDVPGIGDFVVTLLRAKECDPDSLPPDVTPPPVPPPPTEVADGPRTPAREPRGGRQGGDLGGGAPGGKQGTDGERGAPGQPGLPGAGIDMDEVLRLLGQRGGAGGPGFIGGPGGGPAGGGHESDDDGGAAAAIARAMENCSVDTLRQAQLMAMPLAEFREFVAAHAPVGALRVEAIEELDLVRLHGALFDADELEALVQRLCGALPRIQPELRIDAWDVCRRLEQELEDAGAQGVRVHPYLFPDDPTLFVLYGLSEGLDARAVTAVAERFLVNEDLLRVLGYPLE